MSVSSIQPANPVNSLLGSTPFGKFLTSKFYKATREIQHNTILNRATLEFLGADIPSSLTELVGRNWKTAVEVGFRITLFLATSFFIPLLFMPILNMISARKNNLPKEFSSHFLTQFEDLIPEKDTKEENVKFKQKLIELHGKERVEKYFGRDEARHLEKVREYKQKMVKAKTDVMRMDLICDGLLTYTVSWVQNIFSKKVLGVVGYTGEDTYLSDTQKEESAKFHEKTKFLKFLIGLPITFFGGIWYSNKVKEAATKSESELKGSKLMEFVRRNLKQFDYYKEIYSNKLNLAGTFLFGGDAGFLLSCRSLNEFFERILRLVVFWPSMFFGIEWFNFKLCEKHDKKAQTSLVDYENPKELGIRQVKSLEMLEDELRNAVQENNSEKINKLADSIKTQVKNYWLSILVSALTMGVGLTGANIIGTKMRIARGIY